MRTNDVRPAVFLGVAAGVLMPWMVLLSLTLPDETHVRNWALAWIGLDLLLVAGCIGTVLLLRRGDERYRITASATAAAAGLDCWFDLTTSVYGAELTQAAASAIGELLLAGVCAHLALRSCRGRRE
ncbi:hypothetical protein [Nocardia pseudobrasiliensis]|uniref:Uncharacterized protein n=1 Tax=Nocardia pseudobrasiliensis TaxID=45979 RepID=A0A370I987_9NOCA|nr:hypothetical protein [Nocardia pseudobrasiliensis]RDI67292.1 hypothetical protein DFR76_103363 [Nocardia pseudobrasiliensis]